MPASPSAGPPAAGTPRTGSCRVVVVEDDALTRSTVAAALVAGGLEVVGSASTAAEAMRVVAETGPDAVLLDLDLGSGPTGADVAVALRQRDASLGIVLLTSFDDPRLLDGGLPSLPAGTVYLRKRQVGSIAEVVRAIEGACRRPTAGGFTLDGRRTNELTDAQFDLLRDVAQGRTNAQIADARGISVSAVEKSLRRLAAHLGIDAADGNPRALLIQAYLRMSGRDVRA